jgi:hypothetical protein
MSTALNTGVWRPNECHISNGHDIRLCSVASNMNTSPPSSSDHIEHSNGADPATAEVMTSSSTITKKNRKWMAQYFSTVMDVTDVGPDDIIIACVCSILHIYS